MAREMLYEESATSARAQKESVFYTLFLVASIVCFAFAGITTFFATSVIRGFFADDALSNTGKIVYTVTWVVFIAAFLALGVILWFIKKRFNVSYDYNFVEDELRVTKIFNGRSRKYLTTIAAGKILKIGWCDRQSYADVLRGLQGKPVRLTPNKIPAEDKEFIYLLTAGSLQRTVYVLECTRQMLEYIVLAAGRRVLDEN